MAKSPKRKVGWSPTAITVALSLTLMVLTWAAAASAFATARFQADIAAAEAAGEDPPDVDYLKRPRLRRASGLAFGVLMVWTFIKNAFVEIPHAPQVIWFALTQRIMIPIGWVVGEGLIILMGVALKLAERAEAASKTRKRKPAVPGIVVAKPTDD
jgi:hypothetical protein